MFTTEMITCSKSTWLDTTTNLKPNHKLVSKMCKQAARSNDMITPNQAPEGFPITHLPLEIQHQIYASYFSSLPPISTPTTSTSICLLTEMYTRTPLLLSSPYFEYAIPPALVYKYAVFIFERSDDVKSFVSSDIEGLRRIRHVRILYGDICKEGPDWVYILLENLREVKSVVFVVSGRVGSRCEKCKKAFHDWWRCIRDALREGVATRRDGVVGGGIRSGRGVRGIRVSVEDESGKEVVSAFIDGKGKY